MRKTRMRTRWKEAAATATARSLYPATRKANMRKATKMMRKLLLSQLGQNARGTIQNGLN